MLPLCLQCHSKKNMAAEWLTALLKKKKKKRKYTAAWRKDVIAYRESLEGEVWCAWHTQAHRIQPSSNDFTQDTCDSVTFSSYSLFSCKVHTAPYISERRPRASSHLSWPSQQGKRKKKLGGATQVKTKVCAPCCKNIVSVRNKQAVQPNGTSD